MEFSYLIEILINVLIIFGEIKIFFLLDFQTRVFTKSHSLIQKVIQLHNVEEDLRVIQVEHKESQYQVQSLTTPCGTAK